MNLELHITFLGILIAIVFTISMGGLLWWMLRVPPPIPLETARTIRSVDAIKRILIPTIGIQYSNRGVELACRLGQEQKSEIILTYVIEIPRTLPLGVPMPDAEARAKEALEHARAIVSLHGLESIITVERSREAGEGIVKVAKDNDVDLIIMGIRPRVSAREELFGRTTSYLLKHSPCEVIFDKLPSI